jgi:hypothetical protein
VLQTFTQSLRKSIRECSVKLLSINPVFIVFCGVRRGTLEQGFSILFSLMSTIVILLFASVHGHKMSTRTSTVYKYVKEYYPISKEHLGAHKHQVENPYPRRWIWQTGSVEYPRSLLT